MIELCELASIQEGSARAFNVKSLADVFAVKKRGELFVYRNLCPHLYIPLNWEPDSFLDSSGDLIQCSNHGAMFTIEDGECLQGPCRGEHLKAIDFELQDGAIFIDKRLLDAG